MSTHVRTAFAAALVAAPLIAAPLIASPLIASPWLASSAPPADRLSFHVAPGTKLLKTCKVSHELRIDDIGMIMDELPFVSERSGGWISSSQSIEFVDDYLQTREGLPLEFRRAIRDASATGKANVTRQNGQVIPDSSRSASPLRQQNVHFTWIEDEQDWSRCYERVDSEEEWLAPLYGEFELLALLPKGEVKEGDAWEVDLKEFARVLAPGGNLQLTPSGGNLFGRLMEVGVGGDFADYYEPLGGTVRATYKGTRSESVGQGDGSAQVQVGVVALELNLASSADRTQLYRMAMPEDERRENSRLENVTVEYSLAGTGELTWDLAAGHFHALNLEGQEGYVASIHKTRFDGREQHKITSQSRYSGPLVFEITCRDGSNVGTEKERDNPKLAPGAGGGRKGKKK